MSAIAALTAGDHYAKAFAAGIRWGMGHSTGLFVVACIFLSLKGQLDLDKVRRSTRPLRGEKRVYSIFALVFDAPILESGPSPASCTEYLISAMRCQPCMLSQVGHVCDWVIGVLMISLGIYTMLMVRPASLSACQTATRSC